MRESVILKSNSIDSPLPIDNNGGKLFVSKRSDGVNKEDYSSLNEFVLSTFITRTKRMPQSIIESDILSNHNEDNTPADKKSRSDSGSSSKTGMSTSSKNEDFRQKLTEALKVSQDTGSTSHTQIVFTSG